MHEYSIVAALITQVEGIARQHGASAVHRLHLQLGELSGVETELLATAYRTFRERSVCQAASLEIHPVAARWSCPRCDHAFAKGQVLRCPRCDLPARLAEGDEIILERIELEIPDHTETLPLESPQGPIHTRRSSDVQ
jgi:hydrogenase nickel incorporation protein HypA/HybF